MRKVLMEFLNRFLLHVLFLSCLHYPGCLLFCLTRSNFKCPTIIAQDCWHFCHHRVQRWYLAQKESFRIAVASFNNNTLPDGLSSLFHNSSSSFSHQSYALPNSLADYAYSLAHRYCRNLKKVLVLFIRFRRLNSARGRKNASHSSLKRQRSWVGPVRDQA